MFKFPYDMSLLGTDLNTFLLGPREQNACNAIHLFQAKEYLQLAEEEENIQRVFVANIKMDNVITQGMTYKLSIFYRLKS